MKKYKIVCRIIFSDYYKEHFKPRKNYTQQTCHYKAKSKKHALEKLKKFRDIENGKYLPNLGKWKIVSVEVVE